MTNSFRSPTVGRVEKPVTPNNYLKMRARQKTLRTKGPLDVTSLVLMGATFCSDSPFNGAIFAFNVRSLKMATAELVSSRKRTISKLVLKYDVTCLFVIASNRHVKFKNKI